jgi:sugar-specific transcriptional regulator TrmB
MINFSGGAMAVENIEAIFSKLGLTEYESKTLTSLFKLGEAKAPVISREAQVPKTRVYDVLDKLVGKGLVIEIQGRPKRYRVVEADKVFASLLEKRRRELQDLERKIGHVVKTLDSQRRVDYGTGRIMKVKDRQDFVKILAQELKSAKNSILGFSVVGANEPEVIKALNEAKSKNVEVRVLHGEAPKLLDELKVAGVKAKKLSHKLEAFIIDDKKLVLGLTDLKEPSDEYHFGILVNSPLVEPLKQHFSEAWSKARPL